MNPRPVAGNSEQGRRLVIERPPVIVEDVTDYDIEDDGRVLLWSGAKPAGDFRPGTVAAVYYAPSEQPISSPLPEPQARAG